MKFQNFDVFFSPNDVYWLPSITNGALPIVIQMKVILHYWTYSSSSCEEEEDEKEEKDF